ncbi:helix-turn-helix transcriptional regulator [Nibrella saemangeumensis]|uniref:helix-turn-helix transcriptional regulator n=1 Tax=Nibrella saemangeumensis TaxID=1084526 RepID=UPI0031E79152
MNINDKIKQILIDKHLSPSYFADEIGVQRSSISHILSGRNRPSFDIIQKIIRRFPDLGYDWILEDDSQSSTNTANPAPKPVSRREETASVSPWENNLSAAIPRQRRVEITPVSTPPPAAETTTPRQDKKIERILIFYTDGTFREFSPE